MPLIYITRKEHFSASHTLHNPAITDERNLDIFGKCNNLHGHNYYIEVTLKGTPSPESGYVMDLKYLKKIIKEEILDLVDHRNLNDLEIFREVIPTTENMTIKFWELLEPKVLTENSELYSIKLYETDKNWVEYFGGK